MKTKRMILMCLCLLILSTFLTSCAWPRRKPLEVTPFSQKITEPRVKNIRILLEESVLGKPLNETVWDNATGPFWDIKESKQIGFTQHYKPQFFAIPPALVPIVAQSGANLIDSRIVIPLGNILSSKLDSAVQKNFRNSELCFDEKCTKNVNDGAVLKIKIVNFAVWEQPPNHLNLYVKGKTNYLHIGTQNKEYVFERSMLAKKLGSVFDSHRMIITEMNKMADQFVEELTAEILEKGL